MNFRSARQVFHDAFANYGMSPKLDGASGSGGSGGVPGANDNQIMNSIDMGKAQAVIARLKPPARSWGMWCYTDQATTTDHNRIKQWLWHRWYLKHGDQYVVDYLKTYRTVALVHVACEDMRLRLTKAQTTPLAEIAAVLDTQAPNLARDGWLTRLRSMEDLLDNLDRDALVPLGRLIAARREVKNIHHGQENES